MTHIWDIYEPADPQNINADDPFDIYIHSLRRDDAPLAGMTLTLEGRIRRVIAVVIDHKKSEVFGMDGERFYKVCVSN